MEVEFDPAKDAKNIREHGISLRRAKDFDFDAANFDIDDREDYGEVRWNVIGFLDARLHSLTFTEVAEGVIPPSASAKLQMKRANDMKKRKDEVTDSDNPDWTAEKFARSVRFRDLPSSLQKTLSKTTRGPQKAPTKMLVSMRLSRDVVAALRATGDGWQTRADEALRQKFAKG